MRNLFNKTIYWYGIVASIGMIVMYLFMKEDAIIFDFLTIGGLALAVLLQLKECINTMYGDNTYAEIVRNSNIGFIVLIPICYIASIAYILFSASLIIGVILNIGFIVNTAPALAKYFTVISLIFTGLGFFLSRKLENR